MGLISKGKKKSTHLDPHYLSKVQGKVTLVCPHHLEAQLLCLPWFAAGACFHLPEEARRSRG